ncbi:MAG: type II secretion system protein E [Methanomicrobiales archaeon]|nr:type II secretion system protein E [Methanomicrobiales archaeon]
MAIRVSFTMDSEMSDLIDKFAKEHGLDRNRAILELIDSGFTHVTGGHPVSLNHKRSFEEYKEILGSISEMKQSLKDLSEEVQLIHHIIDVEWGREMRPVPFQTRRWWEFWKTP